MSDQENLPVEEQPPEALSPEEAPSRLEDGIALCLSGGGYRAMLFHIGCIWRLNQLRLLPRLRRVSSVSGGSITSATLALAWNHVVWSNNYKRVDAASLNEWFVQPIRRLASRTIDVSSVGWGALLPWQTVSDQVAAAYDKHLFEDKTLQDFPDERHQADKDAGVPAAPRFVITATNVKTGSLWRFAKPYMADYRVGIIDAPRLAVSAAVAASSAFPPFLSPASLDLEEFAFRPGVPAAAVPRGLRSDAVLTDGGVYDNLGLEPVWKRYNTVLVSDGGRRMSDDPQPSTDWARHSRRLIDLLQHQVSNLRRRQIIGAFASDNDPHSGAYWGIQTDIANYAADDKLNCPHSATTAIANIPTRLAELSDFDQERIINWGYAVCDAAIRTYLDGFQDAAAPDDFPYPDTGIG